MLYLKHGGHILEREDERDKAAVRETGHVALRSGAQRKPAEEPDTTPFDYLLPELKEKPESHLQGDPPQVVASLNALASAMVEPSPPAAAPPLDSRIPAVYTYWGQFIDHDLTANTDRDSAVSDIKRPDLKPIPPDEVSQALRNLRRPTLDLDSVYGDGPAFLEPDSDDAGFYDGARFRVGVNHEEGIRGVKVPPEDDLSRDLPRIGKLLEAGIITKDVLPPDLQTDPNRDTRAFIGDLRNDENLIVAQFHLAFLRFHNKLVDRIEADPHRYGVWGRHRREARIFERARRLLRCHYQWLVVHDYLKTVTVAGIPDKVLLRGPQHYKPLQGHTLFAPLEFSVAAYRFGHSMVRGAYDHNRNFGAEAIVAPVATFDLLFAFTGNGFSRDQADRTKSTRSPFLNQGPTLPFNWVIEWDRFSRKGDPNDRHFARKIDTLLAPPITEMVNEGTGPDIQDDAGKPIRELLRHLARRNLLRGYLLSIPTGQSAAGAMGVDVLTEEELRQNNSDALNAALEQGGFVKQTPLWFYILKEAEVRANGQSLGELGSRIVCETIIGLLHHDPNSYLNARGWDPRDGVLLDNGDPIVTIRDFFTFAGLPT